MTTPKPQSQQHDSGIIWLASYPKSGNTWTRVFLSNLVTLMAGEQGDLDINAINRFSLGENFTSLYQQVLGFEPKSDSQQRVAAGRHQVQKAIADGFEGLIFCKTHNALVIDRGHSIVNFAVTSGAIYVVRNPLDVAISLSHHMSRSIDETIKIMSTPDVETPIDNLRVHEVWGSWSQHVESWTRKPHPAIYVMRYEDMLDMPEPTFRGLANHLLLNPSEGELEQAIERSSFSKLRENEEQAGFQEKPKVAERFFREGRAGQWKEVLSPAQIECIVDKHAPMMERFGYLPT